MRWASILKACEEPYDKDCRSIEKGVSALKFCIAAGALALFDVIVWLVHQYIAELPYVVVFALDQMTQGFELSGGAVRISSASTVRKRQDVLLTSRAIDTCRANQRLDLPRWRQWSMEGMWSVLCTLDLSLGSYGDNVG